MLGRSVFLIIILLLPVSCVKLISDEFPAYESVPAMNSILVAGDSVLVQLSMAEKIDSSYLSLVDDALVELSINGSESVILESLGDGLYFLNRIIETGDIITCNASIAGFPDIYARDTVPNNSQVSILSQTNRASLTEDGYYRAGCSLSFYDNPETRDYYEIVIFKRNEDYLSTTSPFNENSDILLNEGFEPFSTRSLVFSDLLITDSLVIMDLDYYAGTNYSCHGDFCFQKIREHTLIVELRHISRDYYLFRKSFYFYENSRYGDFVEGMVSVYPIYSNVENGMGIFAGYNRSIDSVFVEADTIVL